MAAGPRQGQSIATIDKERRIGSTLAIGMSAATAKFAGKGFPYWHFDANAGSGFNYEIGVPGSPLVFWEAADKCLHGLRPIPFFCDFDKGRMEELYTALGDRAPKSFLLPGDNDDGLHVFGRCIQISGDNPQFAVGSIVVDPNGYYYRNLKNEGAPISALAWFLPKFPRIDLVLNLNLTAYWRQAAHGHKVCPPRDLLQSLHKSFWLVGLNSRGGHHFLVAIGRNFPTHDHKNVGLYKADSEEGMFILEKAQGRRQSGLPIELPKLRRIPAPSSISGGTRNSHGARELALPLWQSSDRSAPPQVETRQVSALGNVRRADEPHTDLPRLPLPGAWKE